MTLVEYGDYRCSDCGSAYPVVKQLQERFGESLCYTFRNFPLAEAHPMAESAAEAAEYARRKAGSGRCTTNCFNLLNHTNFNAPEGDKSDTTFGEVSSTKPAREFQFGMKLYW